jgi:hypothetical protein
LEPTLVGVVGTIIFLILLAAGVPVAWSMLIVGYSGICYLRSPSAALGCFRYHYF